jgi:hypothetical protein
MNPKLIKTIAEVQKNVPVAMTSTFATIAPFLQSAEVMYLVRIIGKEQVAALLQAYNYDAQAQPPQDVPKSTHLQAIELCQKIIANLGYYLAVPVLSVTISPNGININSTDTTKNAFQWQTEDVKDALLNLGFNGIEELLELIEDNAVDFQPYTQSDLYKRQQASLIKSAADFSYYYDIESSRFIYQNIFSLIRRVEDQTMVRLFGAAFYQSLTAGNLSAKKQLLVDKYLKPGLALLTASKAMVERVITLKGARVAFNFNGAYNNMKESMAATRDQIKDTTTQLDADGNDFIAAGLQFITDNPADFEDYIVPVVKRRFKFNNDPDKGIFGV